MRQTPDINEIPARIRFPYMCSISSFSKTLQINTRQTSEVNEIPNSNWMSLLFKFHYKYLRGGKPRKSSKKELQFYCCYCQIRFRGRKWIYIYIYLYIYLFIYIYIHTYVRTYIHTYTQRFAFGSPFHNGTVPHILSWSFFS